MKNCYYFRTKDGSIVVQGSRKQATVYRPRVTTDKNGFVHSVRDMDTGRYYYPAPGCRKIQH